MEKWTYLKTVVDVQTGDHHQEAIGIYATDKGLDDVRVPRLVGVVHQAVNSVCDEKRHGQDVQVAEGNLIVLLGLLLGLRKLVLVLEDNNIGQEGKERVCRWRTQANINRLGDLPGLQKDTKALAGKNHP